MERGFLVTLTDNKINNDDHKSTTIGGIQGAIAIESTLVGDQELFKRLEGLELTIAKLNSVINGFCNTIHQLEIRNQEQKDQYEKYLEQQKNLLAQQNEHIQQIEIKHGERLTQL